MTSYQLTGEGYVIRDGDTKVPTVDTPEYPNTNLDYLAYRAWLAAGNVPLPAAPVVLTPDEIVARIQELEDQYLMPRITRETIIVLAEERAVAMGLTLEYLRSKNKGYAALKALDEQIAALRSQIP
ncbi:MAG: hypothetical protein ACK4OE_04455 [Acidovorax sp.]|uniref:hypothetical protein n=1 Tax=Acidovorax sp. TaxID=1872122 RepID=UPI0039193AD6